MQRFREHRDTDTNNIGIHGSRERRDTEKIERRRGYREHRDQYTDT